MRRIAVCVALALTFPAPLLAVYSNLIALADGSTVYFVARTGFTGASWYVARTTDSGVTIEPSGGLAACGRE